MPALEQDSLWARLEAVVATGNRFGGTPGEARCREHLLAEFEGSGLERVRAEEFPFLAYEPGSASCTVVGEGWTIPGRALQYSAEGVAEGEAVYVGRCQPEDVAEVEGRGVDLTGKVVVAHSYHPWLVAPHLAGKGIAALVNVGETPDGLIELDVGRMEGLAWADARARYADFLERWMQDDSGALAMPGGESLADVQRRAWPVLAPCLGVPPGAAPSDMGAPATTVVVSHNFVIKVLLCAALELDLRCWRRFETDLAGRTILERRRGQVVLRTLNDTSHLPPDLRA